MLKMVTYCHRLIIIYSGMVNISYSMVYYLMIYWINNVQLSTHFINLIYSSWLFGCIYVIFQWCCHNEVTTFLFLSTVYTCQPTLHTCTFIYTLPRTAILSPKQRWNLSYSVWAYNFGICLLVPHMHSITEPRGDKWEGDGIEVTTKIAIHITPNLNNWIDIYFSLDESKNKSLPKSRFLLVRVTRQT